MIAVVQWLSIWVLRWLEPWQVFCQYFHALSHPAVTVLFKYLLTRDL